LRKSVDHNAALGWVKTSRSPPGVFAMARAVQLRIGWCMIAIAIIAYMCAFPELAVLLGIFVVALLFVSPILAAPYLARCVWAKCRP
jgi:hypothetical protein